MEISVDMLHESSKEDSGNEGWSYRAFFCNNKLPHKSSVQDYSNYTRSMYWTCEQDSGFPNRVNHAVATHRDSRGDWYTYSFGGYHADDDERTVLQADSHGGPYFRSNPIDVYCCDVSTRSWSCLKPPPDVKYFNMMPFKRTRVPGCRYGHTVCSHGGRIYMYGGRNDEDGSFSDVECYDIASNVWIKLTCTGDRPSSRDGHACTTIGSCMYVHGGFSANAPKLRWMKWGVGRLNYYRAWLELLKLLLDIRFSGETFAFNMKTHIWTHLPRKGFHVPERDFHTATAILGSKSRKIVVFGGRSDKFFPYFTANDVYDDQFYTFNLHNFKWKKETVTGFKPQGRRSHCAANIRGNILFFGGYNAVHKQHFGDVFILNTETWHVTEIHPFGTNPCPRRRVGCALVGSEILICGGTSPIRMERDGMTRDILHDHNDVFFLHLIPTLQQLCLMAVIENKMSFDFLPTFMKKNIQDQLGKKPVTITSTPC